MTLIPHAHCFFDSAGLILRTDWQAAAPSGGPWQMTMERALSHIAGIGEFVAREDSAARRIFSTPLMLSLLGGEPLASGPQTETLLQCAVSQRLAIEFWTTAAWVVDAEQARAVLAPLQRKAAGLRLHLTAELLATSGLWRVQTLLDAASATGIRVDVRCAVSPSSKLSREVLRLEALNAQTSFVHIDPAYDELTAWRDARARAAPHACEAPEGYELAVPPRMRCAEKFGFYVMPDSRVYPCLAGAGHAPLSLGDLQLESVSDLVDRALKREPLVRLRTDGPRHLFDELTDAQRAKLSGRYVDACDFHRQLLVATPSEPER